MPNWCTNEITITGPQDELDRLWAALVVPPADPGEPRMAGDDLGDVTDREERLLTRLVPMPEVLLDTQSPAPESPDPLPNWANFIEDGTWTKERYEAAAQQRREIYERAQRAKSETGYVSWYEWQQDVWGIKWGDCDTNLDRASPTCIEGYYETPWGPFSERFWREVTTAFPKITVNVVYREDGMYFEGVTTAKAGLSRDYSRELASDLWEMAGVQEDELDQELGLTGVQEDGANDGS